MADETNTWPKRIYLQHGDSPDVPPFDDVWAAQDGVTWCQQKIDVCDVEYVRADIAVELFTALQAMLKQFTKTPSTLKDTDARCKAHAAIAAAEAAFISPRNGTQDVRQPDHVTDLARLVRVLAQALQKVDSHHALVPIAMVYLQRNDLEGRALSARGEPLP